jgi:CDP-paratose 2-epimerase
MNNTIMVFGGAGFVGSNLAFYFKEKSWNVIVIDNLARRGSEYNLPLFKKAGITFIHGDIRNKEDIPNIIPDVICECSAQPSAIDGYDNPYYDFSNNTMGLMNILEFARRHKIMTFFWSTNKVYSGHKINSIGVFEEETRYSWGRGGPIIPDDFSIDGGDHSIYGMSKIMSDLACQEYADAFDIPIVVNRFSCLAGVGQFGKCAQGWVAWWAIAAHFNLPVKYIGWKGKQVRDVLFAPDICRLIEMEINNIDIVKGKAYNIGGGINNTLSLIEATQLMEKKFNKKMIVEYEETPRKADHRIYISDISKIKKAIGWEPTINIEEGYDQIIEWVKANESILKELYL